MQMLRLSSKSVCILHQQLISDEKQIFTVPLSRSSFRRWVAPAHPESKPAWGIPFKLNPHRISTSQESIQKMDEKGCGQIVN